MADTGGKVDLVKINVDENPKASGTFQVQSIPAVYALRDRKIVDAFIGAQGEPAVRAFVEGLLPSEDETQVAALWRRATRSPSGRHSRSTPTTPTWSPHWPSFLPSGASRTRRCRCWPGSPKPPRRGGWRRSSGRDRTTAIVTAI